MEKKTRKRKARAIRLKAFIKQMHEIYEEVGDVPVFVNVEGEEAPYRETFVDTSVSRPHQSVTITGYNNED